MVGKGAHVEEARQSRVERDQVQVSCTTSKEAVPQQSHLAIEKTNLFLRKRQFEKRFRLDKDALLLNPVITQDGHSTALQCGHQRIAIHLCEAHWLNNKRSCR